MSRGVKKTGCNTDGSGAGAYLSQATWKGARCYGGMDENVVVAAPEASGGFE